MESQPSEGKNHSEMEQTSTSAVEEEGQPEEEASVVAEDPHQPPEHVSSQESIQTDGCQPTNASQPMGNSQPMENAQPVELDLSQPRHKVDVPQHFLAHKSIPAEFFTRGLLLNEQFRIGHVVGIPNGIAAARELLASGITIGSDGQSKITVELSPHDILELNMKAEPEEPIEAEVKRNTQHVQEQSQEVKQEPRGSEASFADDIELQNQAIEMHDGDELAYSLAISGGAAGIVSGEDLKNFEENILRQQQAVAAVQPELCFLLCGTAPPNQENSSEPAAAPETTTVPAAAPAPHKKSSRSDANRNNKNCLSFVCEVCNKVFSDPWKVKRHRESVHEGLRPYTCEVCNKAFVRSSHLKRHKNSVHEGLRPYACEICSKVFIDAWVMKKHREYVHEGLRRHICELCNKPFSRAAHLKRHKENIHGHARPPLLCEMTPATETSTFS